MTNQKKVQNPFVVAGLIVGAIAALLLIANRILPSSSANQVDAATDSLQQDLCNINPDRPDC